jgi:hypothetical protein
MTPNERAILSLIDTQTGKSKRVTIQTATKSRVSKSLVSRPSSPDSAPDVPLPPDRDSDNRASMNIDPRIPPPPPPTNIPVNVVPDPPHSRRSDDIEPPFSSPPSSPIEPPLESNEMDTDDITVLPRDVFGGSSQRK